eukprot:2202501-Rhodomonas_salina.1
MAPETLLLQSGPPISAPTYCRHRATRQPLRRQALDTATPHPSLRPLQPPTVAMQDSRQTRALVWSWP